MLAGYDVHDWQNYAFSLGFTFVGAVVLTFTRSRNQRVPQEALIGIVYVVAAAAAILALSKGAGGSEELQRSLVGELLVVRPTEVTKTFALFVVIGTIHFVFRKKFLAISADPERAAASGLNVRWWDFVFYMLFGLVVTSFVHIGGVLLVFSYLVVPAVCATYLVNSFVARFAVGWGIATLASMVSLLITAKVDLPIGAAIVCVLGAALVLTAVVAQFRGAK
jgi:zinc/manganese transport system permease protein